MAADYWEIAVPFLRSAFAQRLIIAVAGMAARD